MSSRREFRRQSFAFPLLLGGLLLGIVAASTVSLFYFENRLSLSNQSAPTLATPITAIAVSLVGLLVWSTLRLRRDWLSTQRREQLLATTLSSIADGVLSVDFAGRVTFFNPVAERLTGWTEAEARGRFSSAILVLLDRQTGAPLADPLAESRGQIPPEESQTLAMLRARDGTERIVSKTVTALHDETGKWIGAVIVLRDVTERELGESALRASQEMFRMISDNISDLIAVLDLDGRRLYNSASYERLLAPPKDLYLTDSFNSIHPDDRERIREVFQETIRTGHGQRTELRMMRPNGEVVYVESVGTLIHDGRGKPEKMLVVSRDITDRRVSDERLRQEKEFSDTLINSMPGIFYLYHPSRVILRWNKNFETVTGYTPDEIGKLDPLDYFLPEQKMLVHNRMLKCFQEGSADIEVYIVSKTGQKRPFYVTGLRVTVGDHPCMLGVGIDITERLAAEEGLRATMRRLGRQNQVLAEQARNPVMLDSAPDDALRAITELTARTLEVERTSVWFYNEDQTAIRCANLYETSPRRHSQGGELIASDYPQYFAALASERAIAAHHAAEDERTREFAPEYLSAHGITSMLDAPIRSGGRMVGVVCSEHTGPARTWTPDEQNFAGSMADLVSLSMEVARRREAESALREAHGSLERKVEERTHALAEANERLKELDRLKSEFLATMSHELRTPLNSIIGFTGILRQELAGPLNAEQSKQLSMVQFSARHLLGLINDLLDLSRIESGKMEVVIEPVIIEEVVSQVVQSLLPIAEQKRLTLTALQADHTLTMLSDRKKLFQILLNLTNNAVKFTEKGGVRLEVTPGARDITFSVIDTGIGIKPESVANLFQAFRQVDGSARRVYEGTGLGLYLCKKLSSMLGGSIRAESEFGSGSRFTVILPRETPAPHTP